MRHERVTPIMALSDEVTERAVVGACLANPDVFWDLSGRLTPGSFTVPRIAKIWSAMTVLADQGKPVTREMIPLAMADEGRPEVSLPVFLATLTAEAKPTQAATSCDVLLQLESRRKAIDILDRARADIMGADITQPVDALVEQTIGNLSGVNTGGFDRHMRTIGEWAGSVVDRAQETYRRGDDVQLGLSSGLRAVDEVWGRMMPGRLYVLAGISTMGKSALARQIAEAMARQCRKEGLGFGYMASLEMSGEENATRTLAEMAGIAASKIDENDLIEFELESLEIARQRLRDLPIFIDQKPRMRMSDMRARAIRLKNQKGLAFMVIDHALLVKPEGRADSLMDRVSEATIDGKLLARELEVPVIMLSQLNEKTVLDRPSGKPNTLDLFGGQTIKQNADAVGFVHRPEVIARKREPARSDEEKHSKWMSRMLDLAGKAEFFDDKRRSGRSGQSRPMIFDGPTMTFRDV